MHARCSVTDMGARKQSKILPVRGRVDERGGKVPHPGGDDTMYPPIHKCTDLRADEQLLLPDPLGRLGCVASHRFGMGLRIAHEAGRIDTDGCHVHTHGAGNLDDQGSTWEGRVHDPRLSPGYELVCNPPETRKLECTVPDTTNAPIGCLHDMGFNRPRAVHTEATDIATSLVRASPRARSVELYGEAVRA